MFQISRVGSGRVTPDPARPASNDPTREKALLFFPLGPKGVDSGSHIGQITKDNL